MEISELLIGTKIDISVIDESQENIGYIYLSQIEDILDGDTIAFPAPFHNKRIVFIPLDTKLRFTFSHNKYGLQSFTGVITNKYKSGEMLYMHAKIESELEVIQRRKSFRLSCYRLSYTMDVQYRVYDKLEDIDSEVVFNKTIIKNISEGGMCLVIDKNLALDSLIEIKMKINNEFALKTICRVVRNIQIEASKSKKYEIGIKFEEMSQAERDKIVRYIFEQQRYLLKNTSKTANESRNLNRWNVLQMFRKEKMEKSS